MIIINAAKVRLTGRKLEQKVAYCHWANGGLKSTPVYGAARRSCPSRGGREGHPGDAAPQPARGSEMLSKLKVYDGPTHPHAAQMPVPLDVTATVKQEG